MKRIIEDLIEQRKKKQKNLTKTIEQLITQLGEKSILKSGSKRIAGTLRQLHTDLSEWVLAQDREWDAYSSNHATTVFKSLQWKIEKLEAEYSLLKTLLVNFDQLENSLKKIIASLESKADANALEQLQSIKDRLSPFQYSGFERRFRGDSESVRHKLQKYIPYFTQTDEILDLGCGRGEFLELLREQGKSAVGIDVSDSMLSEAQEKGLNCRRGDALALLRQMAGGSLGGIFSAQVIEHFTPEYLRQVVQESFRVLKNHSYLVMETINPLSLFALSRIYYLDPSHEKPLHPEYMRYLLESSGFTAVDILFSADLREQMLEETTPDQPNALAFNRNVDRLNDLLYSSPEYAAIGKKP